VDKYVRAGHITDCNMTRPYALITEAIDTHSEYVIAAYCSSTATTVTRTRLNITFSGALSVCLSVCLLLVLLHVRKRTSEFK